MTNNYIVYFDLELNYFLTTSAGIYLDKLGTILEAK